MEEATDLAEQSNTISGSYVIPSVLALKAPLKSMQSQFNCKFLSTLKSSVDKRLSFYLEREEFQLASILDPRVKLGWCADSADHTSKKALLDSHVQKISNQPAPQVPHDAEISSST